MGVWVSMAMCFPSSRDWLSKDVKVALLTLVSPTGQSTQLSGLREFGDTGLGRLLQGAKGAKGYGHLLPSRAQPSCGESPRLAAPGEGTAAALLPRT